MKKIIFVLITLLTISAPASAADLSAEDAKAFVATLQPLGELTEKMQADGNLDALELDPFPEAGKPFQPFTSALAALEGQNPEGLKQIAAIARAGGFTTDNWATTGDRVMLAYMAAKMEKESPAARAELEQMEKMGPEMLAQLPPAMAEQMRGVIAMVQAVKNVPAGDVAVITPLLPAIERFSAQQERNALK